MILLHTYTGVSNRLGTPAPVKEGENKLIQRHSHEDYEYELANLYPSSSRQSVS